jgi:hypothetical protein
VNVLRSELYRTATMRSSWVSLGVAALLGLGFGWVSQDFWSLFAGLGAFGVAVLTTSQHYQHRTAVLLFLGQPHRLLVLAAQCVTAVLVALVLALISGLPALGSSQFLPTLAAVPLMAVFGVANATAVRRPTWLLAGWALWLVFVEGLIGKLSAPLPLSSFLDAAGGDLGRFGVFALWTLCALVGAAWAIRHDLSR